MTRRAAQARARQSSDGAPEQTDRRRAPNERPGRRRTSATRDVVADGHVLDFISGTEELKDTRQGARPAAHRPRAVPRVRHLGRRHGGRLPGQRRRAEAPRRHRDLQTWPAHTHENLRRVVVCSPEPTQAKRGAVKMRDYAQAAKDLEEIKPFFEEIDSCQYGLWTNGLEFFFLKKKATKFQVDAEPIGDWPPATSPSARGTSSPMRAPGGPTPRCSGRRSGAATTSSTATRACRRTRRSGSSST